MGLNFAFLQLGTDKDRLLAKAMVQSIRQHHECKIYQVSNLTTPEVPGVDSVIRKSMVEPLMPFRLDSFRNLPEEVIALDTDVIVQKSLKHVFDDDFDVALTLRKSPIKTKEEDLTEDMPYNGGVVFSRNRAFWNECVEVCRSLPINRQEWFGDQIAIAIVAKSGKYKVKELPPEYNYSGINFNEDVSDKYLVHYKGRRKAWMAMKYKDILGIKVQVTA